MKHKRVISVVIALGMIALIDITTPKSEDFTTTQAVNSDLIILSISSLNQINEQVQECSHNSNCDK